LFLIHLYAPSLDCRAGRFVHLLLYRKTILYLQKIQQRSKRPLPVVAKLGAEGKINGQISPFSPLAHKKTGAVLTTPVRF
jgi:hypothetical protein